MMTDEGRDCFLSVVATDLAGATCLKSELYRDDEESHPIDKR